MSTKDDCKSIEVNNDSAHEKPIVSRPPQTLNVPYFAKEAHFRRLRNEDFVISVLTSVTKGKPISEAEYWRDIRMFARIGVRSKLLIRMYVKLKYFRR